MKRTIKKQFWFSRDEAQDLQKKAKKTCLSEAALVRLLLRGYEPKEKPDDRFYDAMREFSAIGNNIHVFSAGKAAFRKRRCDGSAESRKPTAVGAEDEQPAKRRYGNHYKRFDLLLGGQL